MRAARNHLRPILQVQPLPDRPSPINAPMVSIKRGIVGTNEEVAGRVAANGMVSAGVDTHERHPPVLGRVVGVLLLPGLRGHGLHAVLEGEDVGGVGDQGHHVLGAGVARGEVVVDVAGETARVVAHAVGQGVKSWSRVELRGDRAEADGHAEVINGVSKGERWKGDSSEIYRSKRRRKILT